MLHRNAFFATVAKGILNRLHALEPRSHQSEYTGNAGQYRLAEAMHISVSLRRLVTGLGAGPAAVVMKKGGTLVNVQLGEPSVVQIACDVVNSDEEHRLGIHDMLLPYHVRESHLLSSREEKRTHLETANRCISGVQFVHLVVRTEENVPKVETGIAALPVF